MTGRGFDVPLRRPSRWLIPPPNISRFVLPDESVRYCDRLHPIVLVRPVISAFLLCVLVGIGLAQIGAGPVVEIAMIAVGVVIVWLLYRVLRWARQLLVVTDRRVFTVQAVVVSRVTIKPVFRQSVVFVQDPIGEMLNYGMISTTTPTGDRVHTFRFIADPQAFYEAVTDRAV